MTPFVLLLLISAGLVASAFSATADETETPPDDPSDDAGDRDFSNGDIVSDAMDTGTVATGEHASDADQAAPAEDPSGSDPAGRPGRDIQGTPGDDIIEIRASSGDAGHSFFGGDGRDFIRTSALPDYDGASATDLFASHIGGGGNTVFGGRGDDIIELSRDDIAEGWSGHDIFLVMADTAGGPAPPDPVVVRDLDPDEDYLVITVPPAPQAGQAGSGVPQLHTLVRTIIDGDDTIIVINDTPTVRIVGQINIHVGVQNDPHAAFSTSDLGAITDAAHLKLTGLNGAAIVGEMPQVIIRSYTEVTS